MTIDKAERIKRYEELENMRKKIYESEQDLKTHIISLIDDFLKENMLILVANRYVKDHIECKIEPSEWMRGPKITQQLKTMSHMVSSHFGRSIILTESESIHMVSDPEYPDGELFIEFCIYDEEYIVETMEWLENRKTNIKNLEKVMKVETEKFDKLEKFVLVHKKEIPE